LEKRAFDLKYEFGLTYGGYHTTQHKTFVVDREMMVIIEKVCVSKIQTPFNQGRIISNQPINPFIFLFTSL